ncbi:hypothetical protein BB559_004576 [Furculomyces boomerangus]|uniref:Uncharacterized protein n=2 Tax=Harpellales TaxID=61421 RepID=A0A2T9XZR6_9FUNG|nr:hypothetical protein BB559_006961 [Furculomyces boomerangus]PVU90518.1 hypothetical protein BB559_004576 [Furculomyces boomerangus]PVZ97407.1 hypothetical protein BB558_006633 [Smittium angustum]
MERNSNSNQPTLPERTDSKPIQVKLVLLGEAAVGKSSLALRYVNNEFHENKEPTIGAAFLTQKCTVDDKAIKFEIWDTAGQERFHSLAPMYYRNAQAAIVVYDVTRRSSLDKAKSWVKELQRQASPNIVIGFVGNKVDLISSEGTSTDAEDPGTEREVTVSEAEAYCSEANLLFFESSAKENFNVTEIFTEIAKKLPFEQIVAAQALRGNQINTGTVSVSRFGEGRFGFGGQSGENSGQQSNCSC